MAFNIVDKAFKIVGIEGAVRGNSTKRPGTLAPFCAKGDRGAGPTDCHATEVLRLKDECALTYSQIARSLRISKGSVANDLRSAEAAGLTHQEAERLDDAALTARLAHLKFPTACLEDLDTRAARSLDARLIASLASCDWIRAGQAVIITGRTGVGRSWLACALGTQACRQGFSVCYTRFNRLLEELRLAHGDGSFGSRLAQLAKTDVLILDDWAMAPIAQAERCDLLEVLDDRTTGKATIITSQLPVQHWHEYLAEHSIADAILDRIVHRSHRLALDWRVATQRSAGERRTQIMIDAAAKRVRVRPGPTKAAPHATPNATRSPKTGGTQRCPNRAETLVRLPGRPTVVHRRRPDQDRRRTHRKIDSAYHDLERLR